jgi:hypothetical protein
MDAAIRERTVLDMVREMAAPDSRAQRLEREAAEEVLALEAARPASGKLFVPRACAAYLLAYYERVELGGMRTHLRMAQA